MLGCPFGWVMSTAVQSSAFLTPSCLHAAMTASASATACEAYRNSVPISDSARAPCGMLHEGEREEGPTEREADPCPRWAATLLDGRTEPCCSPAHLVGGLALLEVLNGIELNARNAAVCGVPRTQKRVGDLPKQQPILKGGVQRYALRNGRQNHRVEPLAGVGLRMDVRNERHAVKCMRYTSGDRP